MSAGIVIVQQQERMVIQRFGRYDKVVGPGFRFLVPIIFNGTKVGYGKGRRGFPPRNTSPPITWWWIWIS